MPCGGVTGGVFPAPPEPVDPLFSAPPPPDPPAIPVKHDPPAPPPPPADVIVEKVDGDPVLPWPELGFVAPPAPTVIGKAVAVTVILFPGVEYPHKGLAV